MQRKNNSENSEVLESLWELLVTTQWRWSHLCRQVSRGMGRLIIYYRVLQVFTHLHTFSTIQHSSDNFFVVADTLHLHHIQISCYLIFLLFKWFFHKRVRLLIAMLSVCFLRLCHVTSNFLPAASLPSRTSGNTFSLTELEWSGEDFHGPLPGKQIKYSMMPARSLSLLLAEISLCF